MTDLHADLLVHAHTIWRIAMRLVGNEDDAKDCYQQTFVDALRIAPGTVNDWQSVLRRIVTRRAMDCLRKRYRDKQNVALFQIEPAEDLPPEASFQFQELRQSVRAVLAELPPLQAEAFFLRHIEQLEPADIADQMGIEPNYVRVLVHRAITQLRATLSNSFHPIQLSTENEENDND